MVEGKRSFLRSRPPSHPFLRASFATVGLGLGVGLLIARGEATDTALTSKQEVRLRLLNHRVAPFIGSINGFKVSARTA